MLHIIDIPHQGDISVMKIPLNILQLWMGYFLIISDESETGEHFTFISFAAVLGTPKILPFKIRVFKQSIMIIS